jgi:UDP-N-acetylmuramoyl-L-alanyl-D-glutamate--2,6-diaminopimelate ligase
MQDNSRPLSVLIGEFVGGDILTASRDISVHGLAMDSRKVQVGDVFVALAGSRVDGHRYIDEAVTRGAVAVLVESTLAQPIKYSVPVIALPDLSAQLSRIAANFYYRPSARLPITGITGTNGKTTTAFITAVLSAQLGHSSGLIGTLGCGQIKLKLNSLEQHLQPTGYTTPDAITVQRQLAGFVNSDCERVVMEVSSHALDQSRVADVDFDVAVLTNLSRDHLDYHQTMQNYAAAKRRIFEQPDLRVAIINKDDSFGCELASQLNKSVSLVTYSLCDNSADIYAQHIESGLSGIRANIVAGSESAVLSLPLIGDFNLANALAAIAVLMQYGHTLSDILDACEQLPCVPGRMQRVESSAQKASDISVVIDFAHTPDALEKVLTVLRKNCQGRLWCVFGCGGDRDIGKREKMGEVAGRLADHIVLTSDNPRSESVQAIIADIESGVDKQSSHSNLYTESDRAKAIAIAIDGGQSNDVVLIAGKGHETEQIIGDQRFVFSDYAVASKLLAQRASA